MDRHGRDFGSRWGIGWLRHPRGATATEYLIMLMLGIMVILGSIQLFGGGLAHQYQNATSVATGTIGDGGSGAAGDSRTGESSARGGVREPDGEEEDGDEMVFTGDVDRDEQRIGQGQQREEASGSVGGVNPFIILLVIAVILVLGYVMFSDD